MLHTNDVLSWIEIDASALRHNLGQFRNMIGQERKLMAVVKSNAYGHGMALCADIAVHGGADWLAVFNIHEALALRAGGIRAPILVLGPTPVSMLDAAKRNDIRPTMASIGALKSLKESGVGGLSIHLKIDTGTNRQGFAEEDLVHIIPLVNAADACIEGIYTHYADIEDTTDHRFAELQLERFEKAFHLLQTSSSEPLLAHTACTAATILFPKTYYSMARIGIGAYGLWPSKETFVSAHQLGRQALDLRPVMTWKTRIAQIRELGTGAFVGYGRTFKTTRPSRIAVLPIGYANGYDRGLSNNAHVLVAGSRARIVGRICMNMGMADVTDIPEALAGSEVVLLGAQGEERISADLMASWLGTINYEVVTRAEPEGLRVVVE